MVDPRVIEPDYTNVQREELDRIVYILNELSILRDRGLLAEDSFATVETEKGQIRAGIERLGRAAGLIKAAKTATGSAPRHALELVDEARCLAPEVSEAWSLASALYRTLGDLDGSIAIYREAVDVHGHESLRRRLEALEKEQRDRLDGQAILDGLKAARREIERGEFETALAESRSVLARQPDHAEALELCTDSLARLGRLDEAFEACEALRRLYPLRAANFRAMLEALRRGPSKPAPTGIDWIDERPVEARRPEPVAIPVPSGLKWSTIAAEFLEDHWQKLILSLAVLLIVVSSTVGAAMVLGDKLWRGEGKCLLATAYTLMFAGFGRGLSRWGAERAGRIMRLTTLIVLPLNFSLVGELPELGRSSALSLAVFAIDVAAMVALAWIVCRSLGISGGWGTPAALSALGLINAFSARSIGFVSGFSGLILASAVFAGAGGWLGSWLARRIPEKSDEGDAPYFAFGLLTFAFLCVLIRIGGTILHLPPTLYALPAMLAAAGALAVAEGLESSGHAGRPRELLKLAGYVLAAFAFALGLARPPDRLAIFSGSTLATAIAGLGLFVRSLVRERRPAFLYASFAAAFLAYFGTRAFLADLFAPVESTIGHVLGYGRRLPSPFRALNGLVFNALLAGLAVFFTRKWDSRRLAWHCQAIGLPVSLAACLLSGFEPLAGVLTLSGYIAAYAVGAWLFEWPGLVYLACVAFVGAAIEGSTFLGDLAAGSRSLALATVGLALWASCRVLARAPAEYREPVVLSSRIVALAALVLGAYAAWPRWFPASWTTAASAWMLAVLYLVIGLEKPHRSIALAATSCAAVAVLLSVRVAAIRSGVPIGLHWLACWAAAVSVTYSSLNARLRRFEGDRTEVYVTPLFGLGLGLAGLAAWFVGQHVFDAWGHLGTADLNAIAATLGLVAASLVVASIWSWTDEVPAFSAVLAASSAAIAGALSLGTNWGWPVSPTTLALACGGWSLVLVGLGNRVFGRTSGWLKVYRRPLLALTFAAVALGWTSGGLAWPETRVLSIVLAMTALSLGIATRQAPIRPLPELALASGLVAWLCGWGSLSNLTFDALPALGLLIATYLMLVLAATEWFARVRGWAGPSTPREGMVGLWLGAGIPEFAAAVALFALLLGAVGLQSGDFLTLTAVLALVAIIYPWLLRFHAGLDWLVLGLLLAWLATLSGTRWLFGEGLASGDLVARLALTTALDGLVFCGIRSLVRRREAGSILQGPLRVIGNVLAASGFALGVLACGLGAGSFWLPVLSLLLAVPALLAAATFDRSSWRVYASIVTAVAAAYLTLFEIGRGRPPYVPALGILASLLSLAAWLGERGCLRWLVEDWRGLFATPLRHAAIVLAFLALPPDLGAPVPLLLASLPFLLLIKSVPSALWLYPALLVEALAIRSGLVLFFGVEGPAAFAIGAAFVLWGLGLALGSLGPALCGRLRLPMLRLDRPPYHMAMTLALLAVGLRLDEILELGQPWWSGVWLPLALAVWSLLMLRPYPLRYWVDGFVGLASFAALATAAPVLGAANGWLVLVLVLALLWRAVQWGAAPWEERMCSRLGVGFSRVSGVVNEWSLGLLGIACFGIAAILLPILLSVARGPSDVLSSQTSTAWWTGLVAVLLLGANLDLAARTLAARLKGLATHETALLLIWWLGLPGAPLLNAIGMSATAALPLATILLALFTAGLAARRSSGGLAFYGALLAVGALGLTGVRVETATTATLFLAVLVPALPTPLRGLISVRLGAGLWMAAWLMLALQVSRVPGWNGWVCIAVGQAIAAAGLMALAGSGSVRRLGMARALEEVAVLAAALATLVGGFGLLADPIVSEAESLLTVAVLVTTCVVYSVLAARWDAWQLAASAQVALLGAYAAYRAGFAVPAAADSMIVLLLAGLDLGIAEVTGRLRRTIYAGPALAAGLILPMVSVALALRNGWVGEESLFILFAAGAFYAAVGGRLQRKSLSYPAGVLFNASLWILWARAGWRLSEDPQFFLVPVGLSTILFAEANRRELGRSNVNAIRGVSLIVIYLSLAVPIWQTASLAAWVGLLTASLAAIFAGIGLRSQSFLWLGLAGFLLDVLYQLGRIGMEHALAKWAIMLVVGLGLFFFVALNEKRQLVATLKGYLAEVRQWD